MKQLLRNIKSGKTHILNTALTSDGEIYARKVTCGKLDVYDIDMEKYKVINFNESEINCHQCLRFKHSAIYYPKDIVNW